MQCSIRAAALHVCAGLSSVYDLYRYLGMYESCSFCADGDVTLLTPTHSDAVAALALMQYLLQAIVHVHM